MESRETNQREPLTLGSLFDGSGGFPLAGILAGVEPVWASEIEPFAIRVTTKRLPKMQHYGGCVRHKRHGPGTRWISLPSEAPVKISLSQGNAAAWMVHGPGCSMRQSVS